MNQVQQQIKLYLKSASKPIYCVLLLFTPFFTWSQYHFVFQEKSAVDIIEEVEHSMDVVFNYNDAIFSEELYSFSISGNQDSIIQKLQLIMKIDCVVLEKNIYAIKLASDQSRPIMTPSLSFHIQSTSGEILPYATVILVDWNKALESNEEGKCMLKGMYADEDQLLIRYVGYEQKRIAIGDIRTTAVVKLEPSSHVLGEIVLTDFLTSVKSNDIENETNIQNIPVAGLADQDMLRKSQLLPGIHSSSESLNDLQIRGGPPDQVSYKWNDIRLLQTSLFYGQVSAVNPFMVDKVVVTRNGSSANQSGQASGSIILESNHKIENKRSVQLFSDLLYSNVGLSIPLWKDKCSVKVAFRKSHNFLGNTPLYEQYFDQTFQFGQLTNDQFYLDFFDIRGQEDITKRFNFDDLSTSFKWAPSKHLFFKASYVNLSNQFDYIYYDGLFNENTKADQLSLGNSGWNIAGEYRINSSWDLKMSYSGSRFRNTYSFTENVGFENDEDRFKENTVQQNTWNTTTRYTHQYFEAEVGVQQENWSVAYVDTTRIPEQGLFYDKSAIASSELSSFAKVKWRFIPRTLIETGVRYSDFGLSLVDRKFIEPRIHVSHTVWKGLTLHAHYGLFHQNLNRRLFFSNLDVEKGVWYLSDERPESSNFIWVVQNRQTSVGLKYVLNNWKFTVDAYTKLAENIWTSALDFSIEEDPFAFADLRVQGLEFSSQYQNKRWNLLWTYELTDEVMTIKTEPSYEISSPFTQRHRVSLMQSYKRGNWLFSSRWRYNSGRRYSEGARLTTIEEPEFQYVIEYNSILENTIPAYHSLDASVSYTWTFGKEQNRELEIGLHLQNLYNRRNIIKRQYYIDYTKAPFEMAFYDRRGLGFTPNVSIMMRF